MTLETTVKPYKLHPRLIDLLNDLIEPYSSQTLTLHFKDPTYSAETGGFHPVEIMILPTGKLNYITDFAYVGIGPYAELEKELDFDFGLKLFGHCGHDYPLESGKEIFQIWQENFVYYHGMGVYQISIDGDES